MGFDENVGMIAIVNMNFKLENEFPRNSNMYLNLTLNLKLPYTQHDHDRCIKMTNINECRIIYTMTING